MSRVEISTKTGPFNLPMDYQVAVATDEGVRYKYASELSSGDVIIVTKPSSDLTLEEICGTLYVRSASYRDDRNRMFVGKGHELPKETQLAHHLGMAMQSAKLTEKEMVEMIADAGYSRNEARCWLRHKIMFPNRPDVLIDIGKSTNYYPLEEWAAEITSLPAQESPIRRLRALHRSLLSRLARPRGVGGGEPREAQYEHIVHLFPYLEELKNQFGSNFLENVEMPFEVLKVGGVAQGESYEAAFPTGIRKQLIGFSADDAAKAAEITKKYGGRSRNEEIENGLKERAGLIGSTVDVWFDLAVEQHDIAMDIMLREHKLETNSSQLLNEKQMRHLDRIHVPDLASALLCGQSFACYVFSPVFGSKEAVADYFDNQKYKFYKMLIGEKEERKKLVNLTQSKPDKIIRFGRNLPYLGFWVQKLEEAYNASPIERGVLSFDQWFSCLYPNFGETVQTFLRSVRERPTQVWEDYLDDDRDKAKEWNDSFWSETVTPEILEIKKRCEEIEKGGLPVSVILAQDQLLSSPYEYVAARMDKVRRKYGISSFYEIGPKFSERINQFIATMK
jgi:hypothetical protein